MGTSRAAVDAYHGVEVPLPDGHTVVCRALPLSRGVFWAQHQIAARMGDAVSQLAIMDRFPREVAPDVCNNKGCGKAPDECVCKEPDIGPDPECFESLLPAETFELLDRFLAHQRPAVIEAINPGAKTKKGRSSTSG